MTQRTDEFGRPGDLGLRPRLPRGVDKIRVGRPLPLILRSTDQLRKVF